MQEKKTIKDKVLKLGKAHWKNFNFIQNPNLKDITKEQFEKLKKSIINDDLIQEFKVWQDGRRIWCLDGFHRCQALKALELEGYEVPQLMSTLFIECKDKQDAAKKVLKYSAVYAHITDEGLYEFTHDYNIEFDYIKFEMELPGQDLDRYEMGYVLDEYNEEDVPEPPKDPVSKLGDLYLLGGRHRLLCGDATKLEDIERLLNTTKQYDMIADPPYNIGFSYNKIDDKKPIEEYSNFCNNWFHSFEPVRRIITPGPRNAGLYPVPVDRGVWIKRNATAGATIFYLRKAEPILFYGKYTNKRTTDVFEYSTGIPQELKEAELAMPTPDDHAPVKSMPLWLELIGMLECEIVVDCFMGTGTTLIASDQLNRICYGIEIDPAYMDVMIERYRNLTGKEVELIESANNAN